MRAFLGALLVASAAIAMVEGALDTEEKERLLDLHNSLRAGLAARAVREMNWEDSLEAKAREYAAQCRVLANSDVMTTTGARTGELLYYSATEEVDSIAQDLYENFNSLSESHRNQILWSNTSLVGCASMSCPRLVLPPGSVAVRTSAIFLVCYYDPAYIAGLSVYTALEELDPPCGGRCPVFAPDCLPFRSAGSDGGELFEDEDPSLCGVDVLPPRVPPEEEPFDPTTIRRRITSLDPRFGSWAGGTVLTIGGQGFSSNLFDGSNEVLLSGDGYTLPCDVIDYSSSSQQIICTTRPNPVEYDLVLRDFQITVTLEDGRRLEVEHCPWCWFKYNRYFYTPFVHTLRPLASSPRQPIEISGLLFGNEFIEDPEDADDYITRILVGGRACEPFNETGATYDNFISEAGDFARVTCRPTIPPNLIESMNISVFLGRRGMAYIFHSDLLFSLDNRLRPYTFQTHADVVAVTPSQGSVEGGTRITVSLSLPVANYSSDVQVLVGGLPCYDLEVVNDSTLQCTTSPAPLDHTHYPGGRGLQREVWPNPGFNWWNLDIVEAQTRSPNVSIQERTSSRSDRDGSEFGEVYNFAQRFTGFFVPPLTSLYTFTLRSDDLSRLYFSPDNGTYQDRRLVASAPQHTSYGWTRFPSQVSVPFYLEAGGYYYLEYLSNQGSGPWYMDVGVKVHELGFTEYPYDGDREEQRVSVTSTVVQERHEILLGALPVVMEINISAVLLTDEEAAASCNITLDIRLDANPPSQTYQIVVSTETLPYQLAEALNGIPLVQDIGRVEVESREGDFDITFVVVFVTRFGTPDALIPRITPYNSSQVVCPVSNTSSNASGSNILEVSVRRTQNLTYPESFNVGFDAEGSVPRFTPDLSPATSAEELQANLSKLFEQECDVQPEGIFEDEARVIEYESYESSSHERREFSTSFCGRYSENNPVNVWSNSIGFRAAEFRYVCFAYRGNLPRLRVRVRYFVPISENSAHFQQADSEYEVDMRECSDWPVADSRTDVWYPYRCLDMQACISLQLPNSRSHNVTRVRFDSGNDFLIDDVAIARETITVSQSAPRVRPGGVTIDDVMVTGGMLPQGPRLVNFNDEMNSQQQNNEPNSDSMPPEGNSPNSTSSNGSNSTSGNGSNSTSSNGSDSTSSEPEVTYVLYYSSFEVTYEVSECAHNIPLLTGYYAVPGFEEARVDIRRVARGSGPISGTFDLRYGDHVIRDVPADAEGTELEEILNIFLPEEGGFEVTRDGVCSGYSWDVAWATRGGDRPLFEAQDAGRLTGSEVEVGVATVLDGGTWIRPIRGDMLRLPHSEPQVEVIINGIPSSCSGNGCSFNFTSSLTPTITSFLPVEGQGGETITIYGSGFGDEASNVYVYIGQAPCDISEVNDSRIVCEAGDHPAGYYEVSVLVDGTGFAQIVSENDTCFHYLLSVDSISPPAGGAGGGQIITINGRGFLPHQNFPVEDFGQPLDEFPWFRLGLGLPVFERMEYLLLCDAFERQLEERGLLGRYDVENVQRLIQGDMRFDNFTDFDFNFTDASNFTDSNFTGSPNDTTFNSSQPDFGGGGDPRDDGMGMGDRERSAFPPDFYAQLERVLGSFPMVVKIGGVPCVIVEAQHFWIECVTILSLPSGLVNVTVHSLLDSDTLENAFEFTVEDSVIVTSVQPVVGSVVGGAVVTVSGRGFLGNEGDASDVSVLIGGSECEVEFANDTLITCVTTATEPGHEPVLISTPNGIGVLESALMEQVSDTNHTTEFQFEGQPPFPIFWVQLEISDIAPQQGSISGGTVISIRGGTFVDGYTTVSFGGQPAEILSVTPEEIEFVSPRLNRRHQTEFQLTNVRDRIFSWSNSVLFIEAGDTVEWNWDLTRLGLSLEVYETETDVSVNPFQGGFQSERSSSNSYEVRFDETGEYYFIGELTQFNVIGGVVYVQEPRSNQVDLAVFVNGNRAEFTPAADVGSGDHFITRRQSEPNSLLEPQNIICQDTPEILAYEEAEINFANSAPFATFLFSVCSTPVVESVSPKTSGDYRPVFTITGLGFHAIESLNSITFGGYPCAVESSSNTEITCVFDHQSTPPSFVPLSLSLHVSGLGNAFIGTPDNALVTLYPVMTSVEPSGGSLQGGTEIVISGTGFSNYEDSGTGLSEYEVSIGGSACSVEYVSFDGIVCETSPASIAGVYNVTVIQRDVELSCSVPGQCSYEYSQELTPEVSAIAPLEVIGDSSSLITLTGSSFSETLLENTVTFGDFTCNVLDANSTSITCSLQPVPVGNYDLDISVCSLASSVAITVQQCLGEPVIAQGASYITSRANLTSVAPVSGSIFGGTVLTISGAGFHSDPSLVSVTIGGSVCSVFQSNYSTIRCRTAFHNQATLDIVVTSNGVPFPLSLQFTYSLASSPIITSVSPSSGQVGTTVTIEGSGLSLTPGDNIILIEDEPCDVTSVADGSLECVLPQNFAGDHPISAEVVGMGTAMSDVTISYDLVIHSVYPSNGSFAGLNSIFISGSGFHPNSISIAIGNRPCPLSSNQQSLTLIECIAPSFTESEIVADEAVFNVTIVTLDQTRVVVNGYTYLRDLTPIVKTINRTRGGTQGGSRILLTGEGFTGRATVTIATIQCDVIDETETSIICETGASGLTVRERVLVEIDGRGFAISSEDIYFWYVDVWSSRFTWGGGPLPAEGDFVVVDQGQTLLLDVVTPVLSYLLVRGGELIFDDGQGDNMVGLHTFGMLILDGGRLEIGTEEDPFLSKTEVVLYGHVLSTEIPVYGAKTLALRSGTIDMHGRPLNVTWSRLSQTVNAGDNRLYLRDTVDWAVGGKVVIASTSFSQRENEELTIEAIEEGASGSVLTVSPALSHSHISVQQTVAGRFVDTSAEVGYLTRNIVVRGNVNEDFVMDVESCSEEFRPGMFEVQTCFQGRFGAESVGDQFGSQIMIHAAEQDQGDVAGRFEHVEVTHAGQAFRLGRYPIHFHLNGNVTGSYVRGCAIHHTFNRAVTMHAVDHLLVERNVAYNILGHAYFLEDGIEQHNIIQDNLGIFVRGSSSLLNVDITPATFWVVNPNNIVRRNAAAGGTHFGFWYRLPEFPTGPSATRTVCPRHLPVEEFSDNTAHSFGWYGLWVFRNYSPRVGGGCDSQEHATAVFNNFTSWRNDRGVEFAEVGALQLKNSMMLDNRLAGVEVTELEDSLWGESGPLIKDTIIAGYTNISQGSDTFCTEAGIKTPHSYYLTVSGVTFVNFDRSGCFPIQACSHCKIFQGGFETRYERISFENPGTELTKWQWTHEQAHRDLDGSLTGTQPSVLLPTNGLLPPSCRHHTPSSFGATLNGTNGSICDASFTLARTGIFDPTPNSLRFTRIELSNEHGSTILPWALKRLQRTGEGLMASLAVNQTYNLVWLEGTTFTNISYIHRISALEPEDYYIFNHTFVRELDMAEIAGESLSSNASVEDAETGNWQLNNNGNMTTLSYFIRGSGNRDPPDEFDVHFQTLECFYDGCEPPPRPTLAPPIPDGRPNVTQNWFDPSIWPNNTVPRVGEDVFVNCSHYIILNGTIPPLGTLTICGGLELDNNMDHEIAADFIIIQGGRFVIGYPDTPYPRSQTATITLHGNELSPEFERVSGTNVGAKAIGVFGELILHAETPNAVWTTLSNTASPGDVSIRVSDNVDWNAGDTIVITSTSYKAEETEKFQISSRDGRMITLDGPLQYTHTGGEFNTGSRSFTIRAEVGLLTRNIVIRNGDDDRAFGEAFGCRVVVATGDAFQTVGSAQISGVEFDGCGQIGYSESFDPRFALAFSSLGSTNSYVRYSSIHDGYNVGIGVFGTNGMSLENNVIHSTVGESMIIEGFNHVIRNNLASLSQFLGTFRDRNEALNSDWTANFDLVRAANFEFTGNAAAGGAKAGLHTNGEECSDQNSTQIRNNVIHSTLHGIHIGYTDGLRSGCLKLAQFHIYSCYHYGIFSYSGSGVVIEDVTLIDNKAGIYVSVIGPPSLSHDLGSKSVLIQNALIVASSGELTCDQEDVTNSPAISRHQNSHFGLTPPTKGKVGIIIPSFVSGKGHYPGALWASIISYPAINGVTNIRDVSFGNFDIRCDGKQDAALMTSRQSEDCNHPVHLERVTFTTQTPQAAKLFNHPPNIGSINPSDCVDMDCDGLKHVLVKDIDGSFSEDTDPRTMISRAEFEWEGDPRRGLGDFRIPVTMYTTANGSRIDPDVIFPEKGVVRHTMGGDPRCSFITAWNMYSCSDIDHLMIVLESLDADTEVRRLSPIGVGTIEPGAINSIDLLNGPMDNGWCGGYTCQERISSFFGLVASGFTYLIALTSTNPQEFGLYLLNADDTQSVTVAIIYTNPQRLDVYVDGEYAPPLNSFYDDQDNLQYSNRSVDNFIPTPESVAGANVYDRALKRLYVNLRGSSEYRVRISAVIQLSLTISVASADDFFDSETIVRNIALLLDIPMNRIRLVNVVRETVNRRRKRQSDDSEALELNIEIGDPPVQTISTGNGTINGTTNDNGTMNSTATEAPPVNMAFEELVELRNMFVEAVQTGALQDVLENTEIVSVAVEEPLPPVTDPTNGVRATPETGGPQPEDIGDEETVLTFFEQQQLQEELEQNQTEPVVFAIPSELVVLTQLPSQGREGVPVSRDQVPPRVAMFDNNGALVENLGLELPWVLSAVIRSGPDDAFLVGADVEMMGGIAEFSELVFSHPGSYRLDFTVTYPPNAQFTVVSSSDVTIASRGLTLEVLTQPSDGNTTFILFPYPRVRLVDTLSSEIVGESWRNNTWVATASIKLAGRTVIEESYTSLLVDGEAEFTAIVIPEAGRYEISFFLATSTGRDVDVDLRPVLSTRFTIRENPFTVLSVIYQLNYAEVIGQNEEFLQDFIAAFVESILSEYPDVEIYDVTVEEGSIIVTFFVTASDRDTLIDFVNTLTTSSSVPTALSFTFNDVQFNPSNVTQDPTFPIGVGENSLILILATTIPAAMILLAAILLVVCVCCCRSQSKKRQFRKINVAPALHSKTPMMAAVATEKEERYVQYKNAAFDAESIPEYTVLPEHINSQQSSSENTPNIERRDLIVSSSQIRVSPPPRGTGGARGGGQTFLNPDARDAEEGEKTSLRSSIEELWSRGSTIKGNVNNNNNNNNNNKDESAGDATAALYMNPNAVLTEEEEMEAAMMEKISRESVTTAGGRRGTPREEEEGIREKQGYRQKGRVSN